MSKPRIINCTCASAPMIHQLMGGWQISCRNCKDAWVNASTASKVIALWNRITRKAARELDEARTLRHLHNMQDAAPLAAMLKMNRTVRK